LATQLSNQIYSHQEPSVAAGGYKRGGKVKPKAISISKTTQLTLPTGSLGAKSPQLGQSPLGQSPLGNMAMQAMPQSAPQGLPPDITQAQGLAWGGQPRIMDKVARPANMPMEAMPNRIPIRSTGMMLNRMNPDNPHLNLSPLRMMATGGALSGPGGGQDDKIPARLSAGEFIVPADALSALGDGDNNHGASKMNEFVKNIRAHKSVNSGKVKGPKGKLPPKAKPIVEYIKHRKVSK
jgi:hypothetical protein